MAAVAARGTGAYSSAVLRFRAAREDDMDIPTRLAALLVASALTVAAQAAPRYRFEAIASPTGTQLWRNGDLNDAGQVAAVWYTPQGDAMASKR